MQILTCKRRAPLNWLYRLGGLHVRILEHVQLEIGDRETARMLEVMTRTHRGVISDLRRPRRMRNFILIKRALFDSRLCYRGLN